MNDINLKYQPVIHYDGTVGIHEVLMDDQGQARSATYEPVRLEASSVGELEELLRQVYRDMRKVKPITEDELDAMIYSTTDDMTLQDSYDDDHVINLVDYMAQNR